jgi:hypothetical protein
MPETFMQQDIEFQPKTEGFSYSSQAPKQNLKNLLNTFFILGLGLLVFALLFLIILFVLNYFNIISLTSITPNITKNLPKASPASAPSYDAVNKIWTIDAILYGYNNYVIKVKFNNQIINLQFNPGESSYFIKKGPVQNAGNESTNTQVVGFFSDLETPVNIGKKVNVQYKKENSTNIIQTITLEN